MNDLDPETRSLLDLARGADEPELDDRQRVMRALASSIAAGAVITAVASTTAAAGRAGVGSAALGASAASAGKVATWIGIGAFAGAAASGAVVAGARALEAPRAPVAAAVRATAGGGAVERTVRPRVEPLPAAAGETSEGRVPTEARPESAALVPAKAPPAPAHSSLPEETALLDQARMALSRGDARAALAALDQHAREFPAGALVEERLASRVFALCGVGDRAEAARTARELLRRAPASPLRARVLDSCAYDP